MRANAVHRCNRCGTRLGYVGRPCPVCIAPASFRYKDGACATEGLIRRKLARLPKFAQPLAVRGKTPRLPRGERVVRAMRTVGRWSWNSVGIAAVAHVLMLLIALFLRSEIEQAFVHVHQVEFDRQIAAPLTAPEDTDENFFLPDQLPDDDITLPERIVDDPIPVAGKQDMPDDPIMAPESPVRPPSPHPPMPFAEHRPESPQGLGGGQLRPSPEPRASGGGLYRNRQGDERAAAVRRYGGGEDTENAVNLGLAYLARMQRPDGSWRIEDSREGGRHLSRNGRDGSLTALCVLPFLAAGHSPDAGEYRENVHMALEWIRAQQVSNGYIGYSGIVDMYMHTVATLALCEAAGMTPDAEIRRSAERAVRFLDRAQGSRGGWDYYGYERRGTDQRRHLPAERNDGSITGWAVLAMKSAAAVGIPVNRVTWNRMADLYDNLSLPNGETYYADAPHGALPASRKGIGMVGVGLMSRVVLDDKRFEARNEAAEKLLLDHLPKYEHFFEPHHSVVNANFNTYYGWYNSTLGVFLKNEGQGLAWDAWNTALKEALLPRQIMEGERRGSWRPDDAWIGPFMGDFYSTACAVLCLQVYYRYNPMHNPDVRPVSVDTTAPARTEEDVRFDPAPPRPVEPPPTHVDRGAALRQIARERGRDAAAELIGALKDESISVRATALHEIGRLRIGAAVEPVREMLSLPENHGLLLSIFDALARIGNREAAPSLYGYLNSRDETIADGARAALSSLAGGRDFGGNVRAWRDWFNRNS